MNGRPEAAAPTFRSAPRAPRGPGQAGQAGQAGNIERRQAYLHAGQLLVSPDPCRITTILGSCIAVCLWDPAVHMGGLTHFILPNWAGERVSIATLPNLGDET
ncbi:MAG TPA: hypothetical protein VHN15_09685, partial [Thermoanaerobaculia bacterium]|nr:hypothetical protein [Thermoanaerobaculia bacterium]